ncbi:MAG: hypothetical protein ACOZCO_12920 [Bacteroidota bacterium]
MPEESILTLLFSYFVVCIIGFVIYFKNKIFVSCKAENTKILINERSIIFSIDLQNETRLDSRQRKHYQVLKKSPVFFSEIDVDEIGKITETKDGIIVMSKSPNKFSGKGIIRIPIEIKEYNKIKTFLYSHIKSKNA